MTKYTGKKAMKPRAYKKRTYKKKPVVSRTVRNYVKKEFARQAENKVVNVEQNNISFGNIVENSTMHIFPMLPYTGYLTISPGVGQNQRVGNQVKIRKIMLNYTLNPLAYNASTNPNPQPVEVLMYLGYLKQEKGVLPTAFEFTQFFQSGGTSRAPSGNLSDLVADINTDVWTIKKAWRHKLGNANNAGTGNTAAAQSFANNDFKLNVVRRMNITKYCQKTLRFNDTTNTQSGNNLFFFYQCVAAGGGVFSISTVPAQINFAVNLYYEDA